MIGLTIQNKKIVHVHYDVQMLSLITISTEHRVFVSEQAVHSAGPTRDHMEDLEEVRLL